jgi:PAS domain S-box-containing protein
MKEEKYQILLIEDDIVDQMAFKRFVKEEDIPYEYIIAGSVSEAKDILQSNEFDLIISDHFLGDGTAFDIFQLDIEAPIVMLTGTGNEEIAVKALKSGAYDYLIKDAGFGHFKYLPKTIENTIKRKQAEVALRESEDRYRDLFENASDLIQSVNLKGEFKYVNKKWLETLGYSKEETMNLNIKDIIRADHIETCMEIFNKVCNGEIIDNVETVFIAKNGTEIFVEGSVNARIKDGEFIATRGIFRDVTERKQMEAKLKRYMENLEDEVKKRTNELIQAEKMAALGQLVAGVAHEINNPLTYIKTNTEILLEDLTKLYNQSNSESQTVIEDLKNLIDINIKGIDRIAIITRTLKRFAKPDNHGKSVSNINQGIKDTLVLVNNHLKHRIEVREDFGDVPDIYCNIGQINQVFMNMIMNSSQAMEKGDIWIKTWGNGNDVFIEIRDNGKGIPPEELNRIFDPFFTTKPEGTGLGLSLCYRIIHSHGGDIKVDTKENEGTSMVIRLPIEG